MHRTQLGSRLCQWHSSMQDPIYAVGSFYVTGERYPDKEIVTDALSSLETDLDQFKRMLAGEKVTVWRNGKEVSLKKFAGYTRKSMTEATSDLTEIIKAVKHFLHWDYPT